MSVAISSLSPALSLSGQTHPLTKIKDSLRSFLSTSKPIFLLLLALSHFFSFKEDQRDDWGESKKKEDGLRGGREKTHGSSPSTSGKTNEKPSEIQTRRRQCTIDLFLL